MNAQQLYSQIAERVEKNKPINRKMAQALITLPQNALLSFFVLADRVRNANFNNKVEMCTIVNAKAGKCSEDCKFCAQSAHYRTKIKTHKMLSVEEILQAAIEAQNNQGTCFGIVMANRGLSKHKKDLTIIEEAIKLIRKQTNLRTCVSGGNITLEQALKLKAAGLQRYHHNLETSPSFFPKICSTHSFEQKLANIKKIKQAGLALCCGGIFNIGESWADRIELAILLQEINPECIPINILHPIEGTPLANQPAMPPLEVLRLILIFRLFHPQRTIILSGGRERALGELQALMFYAGASGTLLGNYLTTRGRSVDDDLNMLQSLGLEITKVK